ncbi:MAG TPA: hypothetical protein VKE50_05870 [Thermoanaerobaculia bacterium]|nr:hypothetical protein [Thermoanaerobaculia bacterium]
MGTGGSSLRIRRGFAVLAGLGITLAASLWAQKPAQSPSEFYLSYVAAAEKMKSLKDILPYVPADQAAMMSKMPKEFDKEMQEAVKKELVTDVKIQKESPYQDGYLLQMTGTQKAASKKVTGWAKIIKENGSWKLAKDDWSGTPPPAPPKIPATVAESGKAVGEFTVNGQTAKLLYARAVAEPDSFDKTKTAYKVTLSDGPWNPKDYNQNDKVKAGTLHYVELSIGGKNQIYGTMLYHRGFASGGFMSSAGSGHTFEAEKMGPDVIAGRAYLEGPQSAGGQTFYYAATFRAPIEKPGK